MNAHGAAMLSLEDQQGDEGDGLNLSNCLAMPRADDPSDLVARAELKEQLAAAIQELPERERHVIVMYYAEGLRLKEIGAVLGITESRVCQLHSRAVYRLNQKLAGCTGQGSQGHSEDLDAKPSVHHQRPAGAGERAGGADRPEGHARRARRRATEPPALLSPTSSSGRPAT